MRWMRWIFVRNAVVAVNAVKKNSSPLFTAFLTKIHHQIHRISYKNSPHRLLWQINVRNAVIAVNAVKKIIHHISPHFLQKFNAKFTAFLTKIHRIWFPKVTQSDLKFTRNCKDASDSWRSGLRSGRHAGGHRSEPVRGSFFFVRILRTRWK